MSEPLLDEIEEYLLATGMGPTYFGKVATGNPELVPRLRRGRTCTLETARRVRQFILTHGPVGGPAQAGTETGHTA